jgi:hypothetical protein
VPLQPRHAGSLHGSPPRGMTLAEPSEQIMMSGDVSAVAKSGGCTCKKSR